MASTDISTLREAESLLHSYTVLVRRIHYHAGTCHSPSHHLCLSFQCSRIYFKIGDLLALITGEATASPSVPKPSPVTSSQFKRRAEDDVVDPRNAKTPRTNLTSSNRTQAPPVASATLSTSGKLNGSGNHHRMPTILASRLSRLSETGVGPAASLKTVSTVPPAAKHQAQAPKLVAASSGVQDTKPKVEPKKGSFKEIMARAAAAKALIPALGTISHKTVGKSSVPKETQSGHAPTKNGPSGSHSRVSGGSALARSKPNKGASTARGHRDGRNATGKASTTTTSKGTASPQPEKVKKAALATTGYMGTARPPPGASSSNPASSSRLNAISRIPAQPLRRRGYASRRRDEDEDMDDFIEYDDDEEDRDMGHRRSNRYDSADEESDMEAGLSDIDEEELRAEYIARREDKKEEELERELKRKKEERKRGI